MPLTKFLGGLLFVAVCAAGQIPRGKGTTTERIVNRKYAFSVARPDRWYVLEQDIPPCFYTYTPDKVPPDGGLPLGGASICMSAEASSQSPQADELSKWAAKVVAARHESDARERPIQGPGSVGLEVRFEHFPFAVHDDRLQFVLLVWRAGNTIFGTELTYIHGDKRGPWYEQSLFDLMRSFRLL
jgi:hypothetical protein